jgi:hypothetical protein
MEAEKYFEKLNNVCTKYYSPSEHLEVNELTVLFKGTVILKQYI